MPSKADVDQHEATGHASYRNWCAECVRGRGREMAHAQGDHSTDPTPVLSWDYGFLGTRGPVATVFQAQFLQTVLLMMTSLKPRPRPRARARSYV